MKGKQKIGDEEGSDGIQKEREEGKREKRDEVEYKYGEERKEMVKKWKGKGNEGG